MHPERNRIRRTLALLFAMTLPSCRSAKHGVALSLVAWSTSEGVPVLAQACHLDPGLLDGSRAAMPAYVRVLRVGLEGAGSQPENLARARVRVLVRQSVAPQPVHVNTYDLELTARVRRIDPSMTTTPHLPLPTFAGWTLRDVTASNCAPVPDSIQSFFQGLFGET